MWVYGRHPVRAVFEEAPGLIKDIYCANPDSDRMAFVRRFAQKQGLAVERRGASGLDSMIGGGNHQGVAVDTRPFEYTPLPDILEATQSATRGCLVALDQVQDPQNLGAVLRSSAAFGADGVIIPKDRAAGVTGAVVRASAGQAFRVPVARVTNMTRSIETCWDQRWWSVGTVKQNADPIDELNLAMKIVVVMGNEERGIRRLVRETCDMEATIPMASGVESLNIASAATVCLYEVARQQGW